MAEIGYGTSFTATFLGTPVTIRVVSPISTPEPVVDVELGFRVGEEARSISVSGEFFEILLDVLQQTKAHTKILEGAEFGFLASLTTDHSAVLFTDLDEATVIVHRQKKMIGKARDIATVTFSNGLSLERQLDDAFFNEISKLQSTINQAKEKVASRISEYNA